jgi:hypothetical protein
MPATFSICVAFTNESDRRRITMASQNQRGALSSSDQTHRQSPEPCTRRLGQTSRPSTSEYIASGQHGLLTALYTLAVCPPVNTSGAAMTRHDSHPSRGIVAIHVRATPRDFAYSIFCHMLSPIWIHLMQWSPETLRMRRLPCSLLSLWPAPQCGQLSTRSRQM